MALFIGTIEILGRIGQEANLSGGFWLFMANFSIYTARFVIVAMLVLTWAAAVPIWHFGKSSRKTLALATGVLALAAACSGWVRANFISEPVLC